MPKDKNDAADPSDPKYTRHGDKIHAKLVINDAATMSVSKRKLVANWLIEQAGVLIAEGGDLDPNYTARYLRD